MVSVLRSAFMLLLLFSLLTGVLYPALVTGIAQTLFPYRANGSVIVMDGRALGSEFIGQQFKKPGYFWSRLSATNPHAYNAAASSGSNYGPMHESLAESVTGRVSCLRSSDSTDTRPIPIDLVTASGSGLDPHISLAAAEYQVARVAKARDLPESAIRSFVEKYTESRDLGFLGEARVNVLLLNLSLDSLTSQERR